MTIYQVYSGDTDKHGRQTKEYLATYLDKEKAKSDAATSQMSPAQKRQFSGK